MAPLAEDLRSAAASTQPTTSRLSAGSAGKLRMRGRCGRRRCGGLIRPPCGSGWAVCCVSWVKYSPRETCYGSLTAMPGVRLARGVAAETAASRKR